MSLSRSFVYRTRSFCCRPGVGVVSFEFSEEFGKSLIVEPQAGAIVVGDCASFAHSAAIQDRGGAGFVLDEIRRRFPWLELGADGGYNAWRVDAAWQSCRRCTSRSSSGATT
jgi:hypothetical protein